MVYTQNHNPDIIYMYIVIYIIKGQKCIIVSLQTLREWNELLLFNVKWAVVKLHHNQSVFAFTHAQ